MFWVIAIHVIQSYPISQDSVISTLYEAYYPPLGSFHKKVSNSHQFQGCSEAHQWNWRKMLQLTTSSGTVPANYLFYAYSIKSGSIKEVKPVLILTTASWKYTLFLLPYLCKQYHTSTTTILLYRLGIRLLLGPVSFLPYFLLSAKTFSAIPYPPSKISDLQTTGCLQDHDGEACTYTRHTEHR